MSSTDIAEPGSMTTVRFFLFHGPLSSKSSLACARCLKYLPRILENRRSLIASSTPGSSVQAYCARDIASWPP
jgi:hypothetical protein